MMKLRILSAILILAMAFSFTLNSLAAPADDYEYAYDLGHDPIGVNDPKLILKPGIIDFCKYDTVPKAPPATGTTKISKFATLNSGIIGYNEAVSEEWITSKRFGEAFGETIVYSYGRWSHAAQYNPLPTDGVVYRVSAGSYVATYTYFATAAEKIEAARDSFTFYSSADGASWQPLTAEKYQAQLAPRTVYKNVVQIPAGHTYYKIQFPPVDAASVAAHGLNNAGMDYYGIGPSKASVSAITETSDGDPAVSWYEGGTAPVYTFESYDHNIVQIGEDEITLIVDLDSSGNQVPITYAHVTTRLKTENLSYKIFDGTTEITDNAFVMKNGMTVNVYKGSEIQKTYTVRIQPEGPKYTLGVSPVSASADKRVLKPGIADFLDWPTDANNKKYSEFAEIYGIQNGLLGFNSVTNPAHIQERVLGKVWGRTVVNYHSRSSNLDTEPAGVIYTVKPNTYVATITYIHSNVGAANLEPARQSFQFFTSADKISWTPVTPASYVVKDASMGYAAYHSWKNVVQIPSGHKYYKIQLPTTGTHGLSGEWMYGIGPSKASAAAITGTSEGDPLVSWYNDPGVFSKNESILTFSADKMNVKIEEGKQMKLSEVIALLQFEQAAGKFFSGENEVTNQQTNLADGMLLKVFAAPGQELISTYAVQIEIVQAGGGEPPPTEETLVGMFAKDETKVQIDNATGQIRIYKSMTISEFLALVNLYDTELTFKDAEGNVITDYDTVITKDITVNLLTSVVDLGDYTFVIGQDPDSGGSSVPDTSDSLILYPFAFVACMFVIVLIRAKKKARV